jgi:hypothetical protein
MSKVYYCLFVMAAYDWVLRHSQVTHSQDLPIHVTHSKKVNTYLGIVVITRSFVNLHRILYKALGSNSVISEKQAY